MKRWIALILVLGLLLCTTGCSSILRELDLDEPVDMMEDIFDDVADGLEDFAYEFEDMLEDILDP